MPMRQAKAAERDVPTKAVANIEGAFCVFPCFSRSWARRIVATTSAVRGEVSCWLDQFPLRTQS
jgi:hypothetical protein